MKKSYRAFYPHQFIADWASDPVLADSAVAAAKLLATANGSPVPLANVQVMVNGVWVWEV